MAKAKVHYFVKEDTFKPVTKKDFFRLQDEEIKSKYVSKQLLIKSKQYTEYELCTYEKQHILTPLKYKGRVFFPKEQLVKLIDNEPLQRKIQL